MSFKDTINNANNKFINYTSTMSHTVNQSNMASDGIKEALSSSGLYNSYSSLYQGLFTFSNTDYNNMLTNQMLNENLDWFKVNFKTNLLNNMIRKLISRVLDDYSLVDAKDKEHSFKDSIIIESKGQRYEFFISDKMLELCLMNCLLYNKCYLMFTVKDNIPVINVIEPWRVKKINDKTNILSITDNAYFYQINDDMINMYGETEKGDWGIVKSYDNKLGAEFILRIDMDYNLINMATLENILMYSQLDSLTQKEISNGGMTVFADEGYFDPRYNPNKLIYRLLKTPESFTPDNGLNKLFEVVNPDLRAGQIRELYNTIIDKIASSLLLDKTALGLDSSIETATAAKIKNATAIETINSLKYQFQQAFNTAMYNTFGESVVIRIENYKFNDMESLLQQAQMGLASHVMSTERAVKLITNDITEQEYNREVVLVKYENDIPFTPEQAELAKEMGLTLTVENNDLME